MLSAVIGRLERAMTTRDQHIPAPTGLRKVLEMLITTLIQITGDNDGYQLNK